ncbi:hypothetical protein SRHO_G00179850 [Serrasalmus rhombeus]
MKSGTSQQKPGNGVELKGSITISSAVEDLKGCHVCEHPEDNITGTRNSSSFSVLHTNMDYFFKAVSGTVTAVAGGTAAAAKALADTRVEVAKGISEGFQEAMAEKDRACTEGEKRLVIVDLLTKPVAGGISAGIKGIAKAPWKVVEGAVEANTDDVFKAIGVTAAGLAGGTIGVMKAVVDTSVDVVKGVKEGIDETRNEVDSSSTEEDGLMAYADVLTKPVASGISAGIKGIAQAPRKVIAGTVEGLEAVSNNRP